LNNHLFEATEAGMALAINDTAPDFEAETTEGRIRFHDWIGNQWAVLFSHPKDFTPVCTTELGYMAKIKPEFDQRGVKIIGLSVDPIDKHGGWAKDIKETQGYAPNYPIIADTDFNVSKLYGMLQLTAKHKVATPVNWKQGEDVIIAGSVSDEDAKKQYPQGWKAPKPYIRIVPQPRP
jgi:thioredoxin-dependent peroxiredoxin